MSGKMSRSLGVCYSSRLIYTALSLPEKENKFLYVHLLLKQILCDQKLYLLIENSLTLLLGMLLIWNWVGKVASDRNAKISKQIHTAVFGIHKDIEKNNYAIPDC